MIRVLIFLGCLVLLALGAVWIADRPGDVAITWQGYRIETSVAVLAVAAGLVAIVAILLWSAIRNILRSPDLVAMFLSQRRGVRGYLAISRGLVAVGAGDARAARRYADEAEKIAPGEPLALLLNAQSAQLSGDRASAEIAFRAMAEREDTRLLGLRGLYIEARRREDAEAARGYAEAAAKAQPSLAWAGQAVLDDRCAAGDWTGAQAALDRNSRYGLIDKETYRRQRAVLLTARAIAAEESDRDRARGYVLDALKLAPTLVPAAELAGRLLGESGELRRASRVVEKAWIANPHPDLADTYAHLRMGDSARERLARVQSLAQRTPGHREAALAVAQAAIDALEFAAAREALRPLLREPTQRVAETMAELERRESGNEGRAREWMGRALHAARDPAWTADGIVSDRWLPVSPVSGKLDAFQWKVPLAELTDARRVIEADEPLPEEALREIAADPAPEAPPESGALPARTGAPDAAPAAAEPAARPAAGKAAPPRAEAVVPLAHVPDDPGPDAPPETDPQPESGARRIGLFR